MTIETIQVSTAAGLLSALSAATGGETIELAPGSYGNIYLTQYNFSQSVNIVGGTFASMQVVSCSGLNFEDTTVNFVPDASSTFNSQGVRIYLSQDISFDGATLVGGLSVNGVDATATNGDATGNVLGYPVGKGIGINDSSNISITNSDISTFAKGIVISNSHDLLIDNNDIHDLRTTPISGSVTSNLTISNNHTWNSTPWNFGSNGDHGDRIHIWTDSTPITGLVIKDNLLEQGTGDAMLGIFLNDSSGNLGFVDVVISGNTLIDGTGQGVLLENVSGTVSNNTLIWSGTGTEASNSPRFDVNLNSNHINFTDNTGNVDINDGPTYLNFVRQNGTIVEASTMSSADRDTIKIDTTVITAHNSYTLNATTSDLFFEGGTGNFVGTGNALANHIVGSTGNDTLTGNGGADFLEGKTGNDTYVVDNAAQRIYDSGGTELVKSSISWTLQTGLENLTYTGTVGATLAGNASANTIIGGSGADRLIGNGNADKLQGGLGNDTYVIDNLSQVITDTGGTDTIEASLNWTLQSGIENLTLTGAAVNANGNTSANILRGNANNNTLDGKTGADTMYGGAGNDTYIVDNVGDKAYEFDGGVDLGGIDTVKVSVSSFTLAAGVEALTYTASSAFTGTGNSLANTITSGSGNDVIDGGAGDDIISTKNGDDIINGGAGVDQLSGGSGNDTFIFVKGEMIGDTITDFDGRGTAVGDVIELRGWGVGTTITQVALSNFWIVHDGITGEEEYLTIKGFNPATDVVFSQVVTSAATPAAATATMALSAFAADTQGIDLQAIVLDDDSAEVLPADDSATDVWLDASGDADIDFGEVGDNGAQVASEDAGNLSDAFESAASSTPEHGLGRFGLDAVGGHAQPIAEAHMPLHVA